MFDFATLKELITYLAGPGLPWFVGIVISIIASRFEGWGKLPNDLKTAISATVAVAFAFAFKYLNVPLIFDNETLNFIYNIIIFYISSQKQHDRNILRASRFALLRAEINEKLG